MEKEENEKIKEKKEEDEKEEQIIRLNNKSTYKSLLFLKILYNNLKYKIHNHHNHNFYHKKPTFIY